MGFFNFRPVSYTVFSTNPKPTIYRNLYENTGPVTSGHMVQRTKLWSSIPVNTKHLYNIYAMLDQADVIQMFYKYRHLRWPAVVLMSAILAQH